MSDELLWDLNETARQLGSVSTRTVQRLIKRGELRSVQVLRRVKVQASSVRSYVDRNMQPAHNLTGVGPAVQKGDSTCHTVAKTVPSGGFRTSTQAAKELGVLLEQRTERRQKR